MTPLTHTPGNRKQINSSHWDKWIYLVFRNTLKQTSYLQKQHLSGHYVHLQMFQEN